MAPYKDRKNGSEQIEVVLTGNYTELQLSLPFKIKHQTDYHVFLQQCSELAG